MNPPPLWAAKNTNAAAPMTAPTIGARRVLMSLSY
jgi:hypothetical protein